MLAGRQSYPGTICRKDCGWPLRKEAQLQLCGRMHLPAAHHDWSLCTPACGVLLYIGHLAGEILKVHCLFMVMHLFILSVAPVDAVAKQHHNDTVVGVLQEAWDSPSPALYRGLNCAHYDNPYAYLIMLDRGAITPLHIVGLRV